MIDCIQDRWTGFEIYVICYDRFSIKDVASGLSNHSNTSFQLKFGALRKKTQQFAKMVRFFETFFLDWLGLFSKCIISMVDFYQRKQSDNKPNASICDHSLNTINSLKKKYLAFYNNSKKCLLDHTFMVILLWFKLNYNWCFLEVLGCFCLDCCSQRWCITLVQQWIPIFSASTNF